jgi:hypothetical protein
MSGRSRKLLFLAPLAILGLVVFAAIGGEIVLQLWNRLLPQIFGWREITFWQALGLLVLCRILFGGSGWHGSSLRSNVRRRMEERMAERWERMTPEERERLRHGLRGRCGFGPSPGDSKGE